MATIQDELQKFTADLQDHIVNNFKSDTHNISLLGVTFHIKEKNDNEERNLNANAIIQPLCCHLNSQGQVVCD